MAEQLTPEQSFWGWKLLGITIVISVIFMGILYLAVTQEPDYMPSQQRTETQQHAFKKAPVMSAEAMETAQQNAAVKAEAEQGQATAPQEHSGHSH